MAADDDPGEELGQMDHDELLEEVIKLRAERDKQNLQLEEYRKDCDCGDRGCCLRIRQGRPGVLRTGDLTEKRACAHCGSTSPNITCPVCEGFMEQKVAENGNAETKRQPTAHDGHGYKNGLGPCVCEECRKKGFA